MYLILIFLIAEIVKLVVEYFCFVACFVWTQKKIDNYFSHAVGISVSAFLCDGQHNSFLFTLG